MLESSPLLGQPPHGGHASSHLDHELLSTSSSLGDFTISKEAARAADLQQILGPRLGPSLGSDLDILTLGAAICISVCFGFQKKLLCSAGAMHANFGLQDLDFGAGPCIFLFVYPIALPGMRQ